MGEKSDGEAEDSLLEQIRILEKQKSDLERKRKEKDQTEKKNRERHHLQQKLRELQGEVTALQDPSPSKSRSSYSGEENRRADLPSVNESQDRIKALQRQFLDPSPSAGSSKSRRSRGDYSDETSDDDVDDVMSGRHKQAIQLNRDILVENMMSDDIFNDLIANKILTTADVSRIKEKNTREAINEELLNSLVRKSDRAFYVFVKALRKTLQEYLANRIDPISSAKKKKRKRQTGELNVNVDCDEVTPLNKRQQTCTCQEVEEQILIMAKTAFRNIRRRDDTPAAFEQFRKELRETNTVIKDSMEIMHTLKILCRHGDMTNVSHGSIRFTLICSSVFVVKDLWKKYMSGELLRIFQNGLVTSTLRRRCHAKSIRLCVRIAEEEYVQCLSDLEIPSSCQVLCERPRTKKLRTSTVRTLRSRGLGLPSENIPCKKLCLSAGSGQQRRAFRELQANQSVMSSGRVDKMESPTMPFYDLRNRTHQMYS
ncbi:uncharacterized protein LOC124131199 [Haliotis rufescens]|uniref:uncharacterized protein LOC124131199 n=1 Tax=Haliotis rufescens TaxID=6454 RepID=UPI00201EEFF4|nr:uncharacterized protein LOC124131199 [Haliotis rufescens]XP_046350258.2 uncharacterized protein LOC124131199 [Haliotis rufescens]XP_046350259.2 uncharacterized protein LOC124131199 [Haliotis rufescens]